MGVVTVLLTRTAIAGAGGATTGSVPARKLQASCCGMTTLRMRLCSADMPMCMLRG